MIFGFYSTTSIVSKEKKIDTRETGGQAYFPGPYPSLILLGTSSTGHVTSPVRRDLFQKIIEEDSLVSNRRSVRNPDAIRGPSDVTHDSRSIGPNALRPRPYSARCPGGCPVR